MKKTIISILILGGFVSGLTNCSDLKFGDGILEKSPGDDVPNNQKENKKDNFFRHIEIKQKALCTSTHFCHRKKQKIL